MLLFPPVYHAIRVSEGVDMARVNDAGLIAGRRDVPLAGPEQNPFTPPRFTSEFFVWRDGKVVFRNMAYWTFAGPNARGQVAFGGPSGLFLWQDGRLSQCVAKPVDGSLDLTDDGSVLVFPYSRRPSFREPSPKPVDFPWIWPSNLLDDGRPRFSFLSVPGSTTTPLPVVLAPNGGYTTFAADGTKDRYGSPRGTYTAHSLEGDWSFPGPLYNIKVRMTRSGRILVVPTGGWAGVWTRGVFSRLDAVVSDKPEFLAPEDMNGSGDVVGTLKDRATLWKDGTHFDLSETAAGPRLNEAISISDSGSVLGLVVDHIPALRGGTLFLLRRSG